MPIQTSKAWAIFRVVLSTMAILQLSQFDIELLTDGLAYGEITRALKSPWMPHLGDNKLFLLGFAIAYYALLTLQLLGFFSRYTAWLMYAFHLALYTAIQPYFYGLDIFIQTGLFYLVFAPSNRVWSLDSWLGIANKEPTYWDSWSLRVFQIHLCFIYFSAGWEKLGNPGWWDGNALWYALNNTDLMQYDLTWLAYYPWVLATLCIITLIIELGYPIAMWIPKLRSVWFLGVVMLHLGIVIFMGMPLFGLIMIAFSFCGWYPFLRTDYLKWRGT